MGSPAGEGLVAAMQATVQLARYAIVSASSGKCQQIVGNIAADV